MAAGCWGVGCGFDGGGAGAGDGVGVGFAAGFVAAGFSLLFTFVVFFVSANACADSESSNAYGSEIVVTALPGHHGTWNEAGCDRQLVKRGDRWAVVPLQGE